MPGTQQAPHRHLLYTTEPALPLESGLKERRRLAHPVLKSTTQERGNRPPAKGVPQTRMPALAHSHRPTYQILHTHTDAHAGPLTLGLLHTHTDPTQALAHSHRSTCRILHTRTDPHRLSHTQNCTLVLAHPRFSIAQVHSQGSEPLLRKVPARLFSAASTPPTRQPTQRTSLPLCEPLSHRECSNVPCARSPATHPHCPGRLAIERHLLRGSHQVSPAQTRTTSSDLHEAPSKPGWERQALGTGLVTGLGGSLGHNQAPAPCISAQPWPRATGVSILQAPHGPTGPALGGCRNVRAWTSHCRGTGSFLSSCR